MHQIQNHANNSSNHKKPYLTTVEAAKKRTQAKFNSQLELIRQIRLTETFEPLDTMTVSNELVSSGDTFFDLCERCVGVNFMRVPLNFRRVDGRFVCNFPIWFTPTKPTSMAEWLLFYLERAIWLQFKAHKEQQSQEPGNGNVRSR